MDKQIQAIIAQMEKVQANAKATLKDVPGILDIFIVQSDKAINVLKQKTGISPEAVEQFGVITKLKGQDFEEGKKQAPVKRIDELKTAEQLEAEALKAKVDELEPKFLELNNDEILNSYDDMVIRGIAKRAGLPVTEDNPKKIDTKYLDEIKKAITDGSKN